MLAAGYKSATKSLLLMFGKGPTMESPLSPNTEWSEQTIWQTPTELQLHLSIDLDGPLARCSVSCTVTSGENGDVLEAWTWQLCDLNTVTTLSVGFLTSELERQLRYISPF